MQQKRLLAIGAAALAVSALLTIFMYRSFITKVSRSKPQTTAVLVAARDLPVGAMITEGDVRSVELPNSDLPQNVLTDAKKAVGRGVISPMVKNEIVLTSKLAAEKAGAGLPSMIPTNMRAVSVQVNDVIAVAGFVVPGTRVDVLLTGSPQSGNSAVMTTTVLENVEVLAAGQKIQPNAEGKPDKVPVITLLVSPEDAQKLTLASQEGKIQLSLRNPLDDKKGQVAPVENASLYRGSTPEAPKAEVKRHAATRKAAAPVAAPAPVYALEVIRGDKRDVTKF